VSGHLDGVLFLSGFHVLCCEGREGRLALDDLLVGSLDIRTSRFEVNTDASHLSLERSALVSLLVLAVVGITLDQCPSPSHGAHLSLGSRLERILVGHPLYAGVANV